MCGPRSLLSLVDSLVPERESPTPDICTWGVCSNRTANIYSVTFMLKVGRVADEMCTFYLYHIEYIIIMTNHLTGGPPVSSTYLEGDSIHITNHL